MMSRWMSRSTAVSTAVALAVVLTATLGSKRIGAEPAADNEPVEMSADNMELDVAAKTAVLTGHVKLTRGATMTFACPRIDVRYDQAPNVTWARGSGGVVADVKGIHAEAPEVELDVGPRTLDLRGGVRVKRGEGWLSADHATINIATGKISLSDVKGSIPLPKPAP